MLPPLKKIISIRLDWASAFTSLHFLAFFSFLFSRVSNSNAATIHALFMNNSRKGWLFHGEQCTHALFTGPQIPLFNNFFIKYGSHGNIHTFKNYFTTVFSVSVFSFSKNKLNPNRPLVCARAKKTREIFSLTMRHTQELL